MKLISFLLGYAERDLIPSTTQMWSLLKCLVDAKLQGKDKLYVYVLLPLSPSVYFMLCSMNKILEIVRFSSTDRNEMHYALIST